MTKVSPGKNYQNQSKVKVGHTLFTSPLNMCGIAAFRSAERYGMLCWMCMDLAGSSCKTLKYISEIMPFPRSDCPLGGVDVT